MPTFVPSLSAASRSGVLEAAEDGDEDKADEDGWTQLHWACHRGNVEIVKMLLAEGTNIEAATKNGWTPLHSACVWGRVEIVKMLLDKEANIEGKGEYGNTPLHSACGSGHVEIVKMLIAKGSNIEATTEHGHTPLHRACIEGHVEIVKMLLDKGANIEATTEHGHTPLHRACIKGHVEIVKMLLDKGANIEATGAAGKTPLHLVCDDVCVKGHVEIVKMLLAKGAKILQDARGYTTLHCAVAHTVGKNLVGVVQAILRAAEEIDWGGKYLLNDEGDVAREESVNTNEVRGNDAGDDFDMIESDENARSIGTQGAATNENASTIAEWESKYKKLEAELASTRDALIAVQAEKTNYESLLTEKSNELEYEDPAERGKG